jgi:hypothetical protein
VRKWNNKLISKNDKVPFLPISVTKENNIIFLIRTGAEKERTYASALAIIIQEDWS